MRIKSEFVNDDWERIYFDDVIIFESHSVTARQLMDLLWEYNKEIQFEFTEVQEEEI